MTSKPDQPKNAAAATHRAPPDWRAVRLVFLATALLVAASIAAYVIMSASKISVAALTANTRIPAGYSYTVLTRFEVGDVFGDGRDVLVVNMPEPSKPFEWPTEDKPGSYVTAVYRLKGRWLDEVFRSAPQTMPVSNLTVADTNGNGRQEVWFGYFGDPTQPAALEWEGTGFSPLPAWAGWPTPPVVVSAAESALLVLSEYKSPELARDLSTVEYRDGAWIKGASPRPGRPFSPKDRLVIADVNGDQQSELLTVTGRMNLVLPPRPFAITPLGVDEPLFTLEGVYPDDVQVLDLDGNGRPEIYLSENLPLEVGKPYRGSVRGLEWDGRSFQTVYYEEFDNQRWVADLAAGDLDGDGRKNLIIGILRATDAKRVRFSLEIRG